MAMVSGGTYHAAPIKGGKIAPWTWELTVEGGGVLMVSVVRTPNSAVLRLTQDEAKALGLALIRIAAAAED